MDEKSPIAQFNFILNSLDEKLIRMSAKFCYEILYKSKKGTVQVTQLYLGFV